MKQRDRNNNCAIRTTEFQKKLLIRCFRVTADYLTAIEFD